MSVSFEEMVFQSEVPKIATAFPSPPLSARQLSSMVGEVLDAA